MIDKFMLLFFRDPCSAGFELLCGSWPYITPGQPYGLRTEDFPWTRHATYIYKCPWMVPLRLFNIRN